MRAVTGRGSPHSRSRRGWAARRLPSGAQPPRAGLVSACFRTVAWGAGGPRGIHLSASRAACRIAVVRAARRWAVAEDPGAWDVHPYGQISGTRTFTVSSAIRARPPPPLQCEGIALPRRRTCLCASVYVLRGAGYFTERSARPFHFSLVLGGATKQTA